MLGNGVDQLMQSVNYTFAHSGLPSNGVYNWKPELYIPTLTTVHMSTIQYVSLSRHLLPGLPMANCFRFKMKMHRLVCVTTVTKLLGFWGSHAGVVILNTSTATVSGPIQCVGTGSSMQESGNNIPSDRA